MAGPDTGLLRCRQCGAGARFLVHGQCATCSHADWVDQIGVTDDNHQAAAIPAAPTTSSTTPATSDPATSTSPTPATAVTNPPNPATTVTTRSTSSAKPPATVAAVLTLRQVLGRLWGWD